MDKNVLVGHQEFNPLLQISRFKSSMRCNSTQEIEKMKKPTIQCTKGAHGHVLVKSTKTINDLKK